MKSAPAIIAIFSTSILLGGFALQGRAQSPQPATSAVPALRQSAALDRLFRAGKAQSAWFSDDFLAQVSIEQIDTILSQLSARLGSYENVTATKGAYRIVFSKGYLPINVVRVNSSGQLNALLLGSPVVVGQSLADATHALTALPGKTSYIVLENGHEIASANQNISLGVGSTFKLAILLALRKQIEAHKRRWSDVVHLQRSWKSFPSGDLQSWPEGTTLTLETLASLMISISDNTATDSLLNILGRRAVEPYTFGNVPYMTTRNMFTLKSAEGAGLRETWRTGSVSTRRAIVAKLDAMPLPALADLDLAPALSDIEWHYTNRQLCSLMAKVQDLPLMTINPGIASAADWKRVAYKGGSDGGVMSMTAFLTAKNGTNFCASATENDDKRAINESAFIGAFQTVASQLGSRP